MPLDFPDTPYVGQETTSDTHTWYWDGDVWRIKTTTVSGPTGPTGPTGPQGPQGDGLIISGYYETIAELFADAGGTVGEHYIVNENGHLYVWSGTPYVWTDLGRIQGVNGIDGATGPTGPTGPIFQNIDGGSASTIYGGLSTIDCGNALGV